MKNQTLISLKDKSKKLKCRQLQFLFGAIRVKRWPVKLAVEDQILLEAKNSFQTVFHCTLSFIITLPLARL